MSKHDRTEWRDQALSKRHRDWGMDCPCVDIDFLVAEFDHREPVALVEYKQACARMIEDAAFYVVWRLADRAGLPFFRVIYFDPVCWQFVVLPCNEIARQFLPRQIPMSEEQYVEFLYHLRGRELPKSLRFQLANRVPGEWS